MIEKIAHFILFMFRRLGGETKILFEILKFALNHILFSKLREE
jgi:hypothetical protein